MSGDSNTCSKCVSLQATCDKLNSDKASLLAAQQQFSKNSNSFSSSQLKILLQEILNERMKYQEQIEHLQRVISLQTETSTLMESKIEELTKAMTKEREKIYQTVKENLEGLQNKLTTAKEKSRILETEHSKQLEKIKTLESDNQDLLEENTELKETIKQLSENMADFSDEELDTNALEDGEVSSVPVSPPPQATQKEIPKQEQNIQRSLPVAPKDTLPIRKRPEQPQRQEQRSIAKQPIRPEQRNPNMNSNIRGRPDPNKHSMGDRRQITSPNQDRPPPTRTSVRMPILDEKSPHNPPRAKSFHPRRNANATPPMRHNQPKSPQPNVNRINPNPPRNSEPPKGPSQPESESSATKSDFVPATPKNDVIPVQFVRSSSRYESVSIEQ